MSVILKNASVLISTSTADPVASGLNLSQSVTRVRLERNVDMQDNTRMGLSSRSRIAGLDEWNIDIDVLQAFSTGQSSTESQLNIDRLLSDLFDITSTGKNFAIAIRPNGGAARSSDNPDYTGLVVMRTHQPFGGGGEVGVLQKTTISLMSADNLTRRSSSS
jgi:hypothetical protein